ncbi:MAG: 16S rRNA (uracil(1498)-N(3))-methyltransferase [Verrucomicrobiae bacterium]|nr:16S rRNA (uracil(1498)-N(3))-methyltransferase [Verrucomicrobiae bacterium]
MHRFYIEKSALAEGVLKGGEWRHCRTVLRAGVGAKIAIFDGEGTEALVEIREADEKAARYAILQQSRTPPPPHRVTLVQALPRNRVMDFIIQKATELGVREIFPVLSERSVVRPSPEDADARVARWRELAIEAAKQCGLNWLPRIHYPCSARAAAGQRRDHDLALFGSLQPDARPLWRYLTGVRPAGLCAMLAIGPEGDFTPAEMGVFRSEGFLPLSLGPLVLRCDTAAVYALSTLCYELGRLAAE